MAYMDNWCSVNIRYHFFSYNSFIDANLCSEIPRLPEWIGQVVVETLFWFQCAAGFYRELILEAQWVDFGLSHSLDYSVVAGKWVSDIVVLSGKAFACCSIWRIFDFPYTSLSLGRILFSVCAFSWWVNSLLLSVSYKHIPIPFGDRSAPQVIFEGGTRICRPALSLQILSWSRRRQNLPV